MANAFDEFDEVELPQGAYSTEAGLRDVVSFSPESRAQIAQQESMPWNDTELAREMARPNLAPGALDILQQEQASRGGMSRPNAFDEFDEVEEQPKEKKANAFDEFDKPAKAPTATADVVGGATAGLDLLAPVGAAVGGLHGLSRLLTGQGVDRAVQAINEDSEAIGNLGTLLEKYYPEAYKRYQVANKPVEKLGELAHEGGAKVAEFTGSPGLGAASNLALQAIPFILGERALTRGTIRPNAAKLKEDLGYTKGREEPTMEQKPTAPDSFEKLVEQAHQEGPKASPTDSALDAGLREQYAKEKGLDPMTPEQYAEHIKDMEYKDEVARRQGNLDINPDQQRPMLGEIVEEPKAPQMDMFGHENIEQVPVKDAAIRKSEIDQAWEGYSRDKEIAQLLERADDNTRQLPLDDSFSPQQSAVQRPPRTQRPINSRTFGGKERGAVNFGKAAEDKMRIDNLNKNLLHIDRSRENLKVGQIVRLMNGKQGVIKEITDGRYHIEGVDFKGSVPIQGIDYAYKPAGFQSTMPYGKAGQLKVGKGERGSINLRELFGPKKPTRSNIKFDQDTYKDVLFQLRETSTTPAEFKERLRLFSAEPSFVKNFVDKSDAIWREGVRDYKGSNYSRMDSEARRASADLRPWKQFTEEESLRNDNGVPRQLKEADDIGYGEALWKPSQILSQSNYTRKAVQVFKNIVSNVQEIINTGQKALEELRQYNEEYSKLSRKSQKKIVDVQIAYDGILNDELTSKGLLWPTREMLMEKGLSPKEISAYMQQVAAEEVKWKYVDLAFESFGAEPPPRIPGYFSHYWNGSWKVIVKDAEGNPVSMHAYQTEWGAEAARKYGKLQGLDTELVTPQIRLKEANFVPQVIEALQVFKNKKGLNKEILNKLLRLNEYTQRGIVKDLIEREGIKGYEAEKGTRPELFGFNKVVNDRMIRAFDENTEAIIKFWTNSQIIKNVASPFYRDLHMFEHTPNVVQAVTDFLGRATGNEVNHIAPVDNFIRASMIKMGLPVHGVHTNVYLLNRFMTLSKLNSTNIGFVISNIFQPMMAHSDLLQIHYDRVSKGLKAGNLTKSYTTLMRAMVDFSQGKRLGEGMQEAYQWAKENNKIDPTAPDHLNPIYKQSAIAKVADAVLQHPGRIVEERGRMATFLAAYSYYKDIMPKREALEAAANRMDIMMGNYQRVHSPAMYTDYGVTGNAIRPFAVLRNYYYGRAGQAWESVARDIKSGKIPMDTAKPMLALMVSFLLGAGASGMLGAAEYDMLVRVLNSIEPEWEIPNSQEIARKLHAPDWIVYGLPGHWLGINIGPSIAAPALTESTGAPGLQAGKAMAGAVWEAGKLSLSGGGTTEKFLAEVRKLAPPMASPWIEDWVAEHQGDNIPHSTNLDATSPRTEREDNLYKLFGKRAISEEDRRSVMRLENNAERRDVNWKKERVNEITTSMLDFSLSALSTDELINNALKADRGFDAKTLTKDIQAELKRRVTPELMRKLQAIIHSDNAPDKLRKYQRIMMLMRDTK